MQRRRDARIARRRRAAAAAALLCTAAVAVQAKCPLQPEDGTVIGDAAVQVAWRVEAGGAIAVGQPFVLLLSACPADAQLQRVDATMPEHRHGMNYRPSLHPLGDGRWRVEGLLWHMAGRWELLLELRVAGDRVVLRDGVTLP